MKLNEMVQKGKESMSQLLEGVEYLNATESAEFLGVSFVTFTKIREQEALKSYSIVGKGRFRFYKKDDLEKIKSKVRET